ncbi:unnamed protein product [Caenorhabditis auriculariae]|uniref:C2H2-type domain-containing protein n=1 Tax=Caenorhabditis auriculariae TaxID=2777116 RepID=A0A8S1HH47_9PELO|nr:unnamed protein product [Caenorhabditis auriculariae]
MRYHRWRFCLTDENTYICNHCPATFEMLRYLDEHKIKKHRISTSCVDLSIPESLKETWREHFQRYPPTQGQDLATFNFNFGQKNGNETSEPSSSADTEKKGNQRHPLKRTQKNKERGGVKKQKMSNGAAAVPDQIAISLKAPRPTRSSFPINYAHREKLHGEEYPATKYDDPGLERVEDGETDEEWSDVEAADSDVSSGEDYESDKDEVQKQIAQFQYAEEVDPSDDKKDKDYEYVSDSDEDDDDAYNNAVPVGSFGRKRKYLTRTSNQNVKN